jgi:hypothetical protein
MANSFKKAYGFDAGFSNTTPVAPIVKHYQVTIDTAAALTLETGLDGYYVPVGGAVMVGNLTGTTPTAKLTLGATDLQTAANPTASGIFNTAAGLILPGEATNNKLIITAGGTTPAGTVNVSITLFPLATKTKVAGVGV